jgi:hypothetical protein
MSPSQTPYTSGMISARSRRLRTIASVLLAALTLMTAFGALVLMPSLRQNVSRYNGIKTQVSSLSSHQPPDAVQALRRTVLPGQKLSLIRAAKSVRVQILFMYAYWSFTSLLVLALVICVWMDFREISRQYTDHKIRMLAAAAAEAVETERRGADNPDSTR